MSFSLIVFIISIISIYLEVNYLLWIQQYEIATLRKKVVEGKIKLSLNTFHLGTCMLPKITSAIKWLRKRCQTEFIFL